MKATPVPQIPRIQTKVDVFRVMADCSPVLLWMSRKDSLCTFFNKTWLDFTGRSLEEEWGVGWVEGVHAEDFQRCMDIYTEAFNNRRPFEMKYRLKRKDGKYRWILDRAVPLTVNDEFQGFVGSCADIGDLVDTQQALEEKIQAHQVAQDKLTTTAEELRAKNAELEKFAYLASHDLQAPLRAIASFTELVREKVDLKGDSQAQEYFQHIITGAKEMKTLIDDLLSYSRVGHELASPEAVDLNEILKAAITLNRTDSVVTYPELPKVTGHPTLLRQVFMNLLENAHKFRQPDLPSKVDISLEDKGVHWQISVKDNGIGIRSQDLDRIFLVFQRCHSLENIEGSGIGLATVKKMIELHGGKIWVASKPNQGTTFIFTLPKESGWRRCGAV